MEVIEYLLAENKIQSDKDGNIAFIKKSADI